jgi:fatty-acyl-CoA synthase
MFLPHLSIFARTSHACLQSNGTRLHSQADLYSPRVSVILTVRWGEAPHAFVVLKAGATATETELRNYARDHLGEGNGAVSKGHVAQIAVSKSNENMTR